MAEQVTSPLLRLHVWGDYACFSRPELKVERMTYDIMTPSAARGVLEAVLWKPQMRWIVDRIDLLAPIRRTRIRRNEVSAQASEANLRKVIKGTPVALGFDIENMRQQRAAVVLREVAYVIHARIELTERAGVEDPLLKYVEMFRRRARSGQCYHRPYLGTREFAAEFALLEDDDQPRPFDLSASLGLMLYDIDYQEREPAPLFFVARLQSGVMVVPQLDSEEVLR